MWRFTRDGKGRDRRSGVSDSLDHPLRRQLRVVESHAHHAATFLLRSRVTDCQLQYSMFSFFLLKSAIDDRFVWGVAMPSKSNLALPKIMCAHA